MSTAVAPLTVPVRANRPSMLRAVFSFPVALSGLLAILALLTVKSRFNDPDMWWHMRMGQIIWTTHAVPTTDILSYTTHHHAWVPHEWLSQVFIFLAWKWGGFSGLMLWMCALSAAIFIAGYALCSLYSGNAKVSFLGALAIFVFSTVGLAVRPQIVGYLLLILELVIIHLGRSRHARWFWGLPPLFALWINCHGSFFLGVLVVGAYLFSSFFDFQFGALQATRWDTKPRMVLIVSFFVSLAALFLNPNGLKPILYPVDTFLHQPLGLSMVDEWRPLDLSSQRGVVFLAVLGCIFLLVLVRRAGLHFDELILLAAGTWLAGSHTRMVFVFGIFAAPILSRMLADCWENYDAAQDRILPNAALLTLSMLIAWWIFPSAADLNRQIEQKSPVKAVAYIQSHHLSGPMLNDYTDGGYLIWAMPEHPVFIDGRADVFEWTGVLEEFGDWAMLQADPRALLEKYRIGFILIGAHDPIAHVLPLLPEWKAVYSDDQSIVFARSAPYAPAH